MSALDQLLERLRRVSAPPGAAASVVAVPSAGAELAGEVAFLFGQLDSIEQHSQLAVSAARSESAETEAAAAAERRRLQDEASAEAERIASQLLAESRARSEQRARSMLAAGEEEAARVLARGRERMPELVETVVARVLDAGR